MSAGASSVGEAAGSRTPEAHFPRAAAVAFAAVVLAFAVTRSLSPEPVYFLGLDDPIYLGLAEKLPGYSLYGGVGFVNHPPLFPILIRIAATLLPLPLAGLAVAVGMEALAGLLLWRLVRRAGMGLYSRVAVLALLVLSSQWYLLAGMTYKETTYTACLFGLLGAWLTAAGAGEGSEVVRRRAVGFAALWAGATVAASDYGVFAIAGCQTGVVAYAVTTQQWHRRLLLPAVAGAAVYLVWLGWRLHVYRSGAEAAVGLGGMLEPMGHVGLRQLLTPQALPFSAELTQVRTSWPSPGEARTLAYGVFELGPMRWAVRGLGLSLPLQIPPGPLLAGGGLAWLLHEAARHSTPARRGFAWALLALGLVLCVPATQEIVRQRPRMFLPLPALMAVGVAGAAAAGAHRVRLSPRVAAAAIVIVMLGTCALAVRTLPFVVWFRPARVEAQVAIDWLNAQPPATVMTQVGYSAELGWRAQHRVFGMPTDGALLDAQVERHGVRYLMYGTHYWRSPDEENYRPVWNGAAIDAIRANPERYPLLATLEEIYVPPHRRLQGDTLWIHGVVPKPN